MLSREKLNVFPPNIRNKERMSIFTAIQYSSTNSRQWNTARKEIEGMQIVKEEIFQFLNGSNPVLFMVKHL